MASQKRYVVRQGLKIGIFTQRSEVQPLVFGVKGSKFKAFPSLSEAESALQEGREPYYQSEKKHWTEKEIAFVKQSIAVDAACSSATGIMEYQGIDLVSEQIIFKMKYLQGTNNIGEFLAIVHGLSWLQQQKKTDYALYSDSKIAINRVKHGKCKTNVAPTVENHQLFSLIQRAEEWLAKTDFNTPILKWKTEERGEIPADFGRK